MRATERRQALLEIICERRHEKMDNLAFELGVSRKTIIRDVLELSISYPIYTAAGRHDSGVFVEDDYYLGKQYLSDEQQQRVAMARALVKRPEIILLDEPMSNLDQNLRTGMSMLLTKLHKMLNINIVYVTHNASEARHLADFVIAMDNGAIVQQGATDEVMSNKDGFVLQNLTEKTIETLI